MLWAAIILGVTGSLHCITMCGPLTLLLGDQPKTARFYGQRIIYNLGRIMVYAFLGLLVGLIGLSINLTGLQSWFSIGMGIVLLAILLINGTVRFYNPDTRWLTNFNVWLKKRFSLAETKNTYAKAFYLGILNGFLPCGLVYMALLAAAATGSLVQSVGFMVIFGLGTFPAMLAVAIFGGVLKVKFRLPIIKVIPYVLALLFIMRGLQAEGFHLHSKENPHDITICH